MSGKRHKIKRILGKKNSGQIFVQCMGRRGQWKNDVKLKRPPLPKIELELFLFSQLFIADFVVVAKIKRR